MLKQFLSNSVLGLYIFKYITRFRLFYFRLTNSKIPVFFHMFQTQQVYKNLLSNNANSIDVGASKGDILDFVLDTSPKGHHIAFEAIPIYSTFLKSFYSSKQVTVYNAAVSDTEGFSDFHFVQSEPAISGITKKNKPSSKFDTMRIPKLSLDYIIPIDFHVDCLKIDCIGSEYYVLFGAINILRRCRPFIILECTATHNTHLMVVEIYKLLTELGCNIYLLENYPKLIKFTEIDMIKAIFEDGKCDFFINFSSKKV